MSFKPYTEKIKKNKIGICSVFGRIRIRIRIKMIQIQNTACNAKTPALRLMQKKKKKIV